MILKLKKVVSDLKKHANERIKWKFTCASVSRKHLTV
jgi:hypothetical protein